MTTRRSSRSALRPWAFLTPALVVYAAFVLYPIGRSVHLSLFDWDGVSRATFVGLQNYAEVFTDPALRDAFLHAFVLMLFFAVIPVLLGLVLAAVLMRGRARGLGLVRTVVFLPQVIAMSVVAIAWRQIYAPNGQLNGLLRSVGLDALTRPWLGDYDVALIAVGIVGTWVNLGLVTVLIMSGISRIPKEHFEAARLDGAGPWSEFRHILVPAVRPELIVALSLTLISALKTFDLVYLMTSGGPGRSTTVPSYEVFMRAFVRGEVGSAAAVGVVLLIVTFVIVGMLNRFARRADA